MSFVFESNGNPARHIVSALEDDFAHPLREIQGKGPEEARDPSDFVAILSEWSFGYGVAWALARIGDPFLSSEKTAELAEDSTRDAWRSYTGYKSLLAMIAERYGRSVDSEGREPQLDAFMKGLGEMRTRRSPRESPHVPGEPG